jgi:hypothetical protein
VTAGRMGERCGPWACFSLDKICWTNPLCGSRVTLTTVFQPCMVRKNWIVPQLRAAVSDNTRLEVIVPISFKGDSRRSLTNPLNRQSHPICNIACNPLTSLPISNIQWWQAKTSGNQNVGHLDVHV